MTLHSDLVEEVQRRLQQDPRWRYAENERIQAEQEAVVTAEVQLELAGVVADPTTRLVLVGRIVRGEATAAEIAAELEVVS